MPQQLGPVSLQPNDSERQELKPLPRLPRGWSRVSHETGLFLRTIGLGIIVTSLQGLFTKRFLEPEKAAVRQSRVTALLRALIHALPLGVALFEIVLNWKGHYVGAHFIKQNYLQFVAKAHEILMQASLATIILSYTRYQISAGNGMPFGAVLGALQFLQISYLWSIEFWSAIMSKGFQARKKIVFSVLILICITVAATAGPSSANLLIPRPELWPEESSYLAVNATFQDIWPDRLDDDENVLSDCKVVRLTTDEYLRSCPLSSLYSFLRAGLISEDIKRSSGYSTLRIALSSPGTVKIESSELVISGCLGRSPYQVCATAPQQEFLDGLITDSMSQNAKHKHSVTSLSSYHFIKKDYYQPYTVASCVDDTVRDNLDQAPLRFARISQTESEYSEYREIVSVPGLTKSQSINSISGDSSQFRLGWVDLPQEIFNTGVPGAIVVHPQSSSTSSYNITTCTLNAGWGSSKIMTTGQHQAFVKSSMTQVPHWLSLLRHDIDDPYGILPLTIPAFVNLTSISYPQRHVSISKSWVEYLNPTIISTDNSTTDVISIFLSRVSTQSDEWSIALVFGILLTTALSSTGANHETGVFEKFSDASTSCKTCLIYEIENLKFGWAYMAREVTTKSAIAVMLAYCFLVLAHIIYLAISGVSSTAWDLVAELVALAMNSSPTEALQNTCAGIVGKKAYETEVRVLKTSEKHLELVFGEVKDSNADVSKLVMNEKYGRISRVKADEDGLVEPGAREGMRKRALG